MRDGNHDYVVVHGLAAHVEYFTLAGVPRCAPRP